MPFLNKLAEDGVSVRKMFSQAPYTEAAMVSILSGENTLESGGYIYANYTVKNSILQEIQKIGYQTVFFYSPYICSNSYLRGVNEYYYTRLVSINPLFDYRLKYYYDKSKKEELTKSEYQACKFFLRDEFETWLLQAAELLEHSETCALIQDWVDLDHIADIAEKVKREFDKFEENTDAYLLSLFKNFTDNILLQLNRSYISRKKLPAYDLLLQKYSDQMHEAQCRYSRILHSQKHKVDFPYFFTTMISKDYGVKNTAKLAYAHLQYYQNKDLEKYLEKTNETAKVEVCMQKQFALAVDKANQINKNGKSAFIYLHVQDFHVPTVFHSLEEEDMHSVCAEIDDAFTILNKIDNTYTGNIIADLGAHYCDRKIEAFFKALKAQYGDDFVLVVTADHGYPLYQDPVRASISGQSYLEAFQVPYIIYDKGCTRTYDGLHSTMDCFSLLKNHTQEYTGRPYILCECGGAGCPDIANKPVWYTYIDDTYLVKAECLLCDDVTYDKLTLIFEISKDPKEKINLVRFKRKDKNIAKIIHIINSRNVYLRKRFSGNNFLEHMNHMLKK